MVLWSSGGLVPLELVFSFRLMGVGNHSKSYSLPLVRCITNALAAFIFFWLFARASRAQLGLGQLITRWPWQGMLHAGHVLGLESDGLYSLDRVRLGLALILGGMRFSCFSWYP